MIMLASIDPNSVKNGPLELRMSCTADKCLLFTMRQFITNVAHQFGFEGEELYKIEMAVDEACSNALIHAYEHHHKYNTAEMEVQLLIDNEYLNIQIKDYGHGQPSGGFSGAKDLEAYTDPDRDRYCGLGVLIMREFMDDVQFLAIPDSGTMVTLRKRLPRPRK